LLLTLIIGVLPLEAAETAPRIAAIVTAYHKNSHADVIVSRLMQTDTLDGKGRVPRMELVSIFIDQPETGEWGIGIAKRHGIPVYDTVKEALTVGTDKLAVHGVLLIGEHGNYPRSSSGQIIYPKRRLFGEIVHVFEKSNRVVPIFHDKHIADNWKDARWIYDQVQRLKIPMMAGSSLPTLWRYPPVDLERNAPVKEIVATNYASLDGYGFHALEMVQCIAERRKGGETGIVSARCYTGDAVWKAGKDGVYDQTLLDAAISRLKHPIPKDRPLSELGNAPVLFVLDYKDGLRASVLTHPEAIREWSVAWRNSETGEVRSTLLAPQETRPFQHFGILVGNIEKMMLSRKPTYPMERTLLVSGALDALLISKRDGGRVVKTPYMEFSYQSAFDWKQPPPLIPATSK
jgi:hypothetical protein